MAIINPASAIIAKIKTKYGKRMTDKDFRAMVKGESVGDVVQYLKSYTHYQVFLDKVSNDIHRGNLEQLIRERQFEELLTLCKYNQGDTPVTKYILRSTEIAELMKFITLLSIGRPREYLFSLPLYFTQHTDIALEKLSSVHSHKELVSVLERTDYATILRQFPPDENGDYDLAAIEDALENDNLDQLYTDIGSIKNKKDRNELIKLFDTLSDYQNYSRIIRLKKNYHLSNDEIRKHLLRYGKLTGKNLDRILSKEEYEEIREELKRTGVGKKAKTIDADSEMAVQGSFEMCRRQLYFSTNPEIVLLAYRIVSLTELNNVIAVVEGVRYQIEPDKILEILIL
ncbi:V0D/AC39 family V-type ATPase subunit [Ruminococcus sp.]|uniref:V0D/AC39 family V-type ATPase subunit n=1 Tax=Ruminococcus sp. TaxID=41978 RepID=UPI002E81BC75|nr:V-type ATPase subunit [Ruminococcus sp.]MEE3493171.1 V-type ATPase subunit [Ruminococcus sp.]